jgi:transcriptional regulator with XRE-family HTH domain
MCMMNASPDIRALRKRRGWTQEQLAEYLGLDRSSVSRIENGGEISGPVGRLLTILEAEAPAEQVSS